MHRHSAGADQYAPNEVQLEAYLLENSQGGPEAASTAQLRCAGPPHFFVLPQGGRVMVAGSCADGAKLPKMPCALG